MSFDKFLDIQSVLFGLIIGSFLNVVIYRLPRGLSIAHPKRSFCPTCRHQLTWRENIPLLSWIFLRGRCAHCDALIAWRYPLVELLTASLFLCCSWQFSFPLVVVFWIFVSLLIVASIIDVEHLIIPHEITFGGIIVGVIASTLFPQLMEATTHWYGLLISLMSAAGAYLLLWGILELGKIAFGKKRLRLKNPAHLELITSSGNLPMLQFEDGATLLEELLSRSSDKISLQAVSLQIAGESFNRCNAFLDSKGVTIGDRYWSYEKALPLQAEITVITFPREAMGFGDVNFLATIGAFLGWKGMLCALFGGSVIGAIVGGVAVLITRGRAGRVIPFGPYLALGALLWIFAGPELLRWYLEHLHHF